MTSQSVTRSCSVLGLDAERDSVEVHRRIGYLPGDLELFPRLTGRQQIDWFARARRLRDQTLARQLIDRFGVVTDRPVRELSKGNRQKIGLVLAFMRRPGCRLLSDQLARHDDLRDPARQVCVALLLVRGQRSDRPRRRHRRLRSPDQCWCRRAGRRRRRIPPRRRQLVAQDQRAPPAGGAPAAITRLPGRAASVPEGRGGIPGGVARSGQDDGRRRAWPSPRQRSRRSRNPRPARSRSS